MREKLIYWLNKTENFLFIAVIIATASILLVPKIRYSISYLVAAILTGVASGLIAEPLFGEGWCLLATCVGTLIGPSVVLNLRSVDDLVKMLNQIKDFKKGKDGD